MTTAEPADAPEIDYREARAFALSRELVSPADLQRHFRCGFSAACRALEALEADRVLGSLSLHGARRWSARFPVDEQRVAMLRKYRRGSPADEQAPILATPKPRQRRVKRPAYKARAKRAARQGVDPR